MSLDEVVKNIVKETAVKLTDEFDRNFERKAFFNKQWPSTKHANSRGSLLLRSGRLRKSINHRQRGGTIRWESSVPYASIHNEGGQIEVTAQMKRFFWAMYYKAAGGATGNNKSRVAKLNAEAQKWKAMALQKVGTKMTIEQRQFIGWHPRVDKSISEIVGHNMKEYSQVIKKKLSK